MSPSDFGDGVPSDRQTPSEHAAPTRCKPDQDLKEKLVLFLISLNQAQRQAMTLTLYQAMRQFDSEITTRLMRASPSNPVVSQVHDAVKEASSGGGLAGVGDVLKSLINFVPYTVGVIGGIAGHIAGGSNEDIPFKEIAQESINDVHGIWNRLGD